jgi:cytochrome c oxidase subunit IV
MHLKHEKISFAYTIILPFVLIIFLIGMALAEGSFLNLWDRLF